MLDERDLISRARTGDGEAFEEIFALHGETLYRAAYAILRGPEDAEDALQEVIVKVLSGLRRFDSRRPLLPWLRRIMVNECLSRLRRRRDFQPLSDDLPSARGSPHAATEDAETIRQVRDALAGLPARQRIAITLFSLDGMDLRDTAHAMRCSVGTVKAHLHRARQKLRIELEDLLPPEAVEP